MKELFLHIGTLKTGSTSIQGYLADNADELLSQDFGLYQGDPSPMNHIELFLAAMRYDRDSFAKLELKKHISFDEAYTESVRHRVSGCADDEATR